MSAVMEHFRIEGEESAPAVWKEGWLPDESPFPELNKLREDYLRIRSEWHAASAKARQLEDQIDSEKLNREASKRDAFLSGAPPAKVADNTEALTAELEKAREDSRAASQALVEHINICIATVMEKSPEWEVVLHPNEAEVACEVERLMAELRPLLSQRGRYFRLNHWLERTREGASFPQSHFPYSEIREPLSEDPVEREAQENQINEEATYGPGYTRVEDREAAEREAAEQSDLYSDQEQPSEAERARTTAELRAAMAGESGVIA